MRLPEIDPDDFDPDQQQLHDHRLSDATYSAGVTRFGTSGMVEIVTTVGYYSLISLLLNGFDVDVPDTMVDPFAADG